MDSVPPRTATEILQAIQTKQITCLAILESFITKCQEFNPQINAIVVQDFERARKRAFEADSALAVGISWGPLHGLPMTVKEQMEVEGPLDFLNICATTLLGLPYCQGKKDAIVVSTRNSPAVQKLIDAGAIIFGKTNVPVGCLDWETYNDVYVRAPLSQFLDFFETIPVVLTDLILDMEKQEIHLISLALVEVLQEDALLL